MLSIGIDRRINAGSFRESCSKLRSINTICTFWHKRLIKDPINEQNQQFHCCIFSYQRKKLVEGDLFRKKLFSFSEKKYLKLSENVLQAQCGKVAHELLRQWTQAAVLFLKIHLKLKNVVDGQPQSKNPGKIVGEKWTTSAPRKYNPNRICCHTRPLTFLIERTKPKVKIWI